MKQVWSMPSVPFEIWGDFWSFVPILILGFAELPQNSAPPQKRGYRS
jgi:hypothetical protein